MSMLRDFFRQSYFLFLIICGITLSTALNANRFSPIREHIQKNFMKGWWNGYNGIGVAQRYPDFLHYLEHNDACVQFKRALHSTDTRARTEALEVYNSVLTELKECLNNEHNIEERLRTSRRNLIVPIGALITGSNIKIMMDSGLNRIITELCFRRSISNSLSTYFALGANALICFTIWQFSFKKATDLREKIAGRPWIQAWCELIERIVGHEQSVESLKNKVAAWSKLAPCSTERK